MTWCRPAAEGSFSGAKAAQLAAVGAQATQLRAAGEGLRLGLGSRSLEGQRGELG